MTTGASRIIPTTIIPSIMPTKKEEAHFNNKNEDGENTSLATADTSLAAITIDVDGHRSSSSSSSSNSTISRNNNIGTSRSTGFTVTSRREEQQRSSINSFSKRDNHLETSGEFALSSSKAIAIKERIHNCSLFNIQPSQTLSLYGREKEILILKECLERVAGKRGTILEVTNHLEDIHERRTCKENQRQQQQQQQQLELILISGLSGTGKSTLTSTLKDQCVKKHRGLFLTGKYDQHIVDDPLSAISSICCQLCWEIGSLRSTNSSDERKNEMNGVVSFYSIRESIIQQIDETELRLLTNIVPDLKGIVGEDALLLKSTNDGHIMTSDCFGDHQGSIESRDRLLFAFRKFFRIMVGFFAPIVVVLDDLQWSDCSSMEFIKSLVTTDQQSIPGLLLIGCYRSNEVHDTHFLSNTIRDIKNNNTENIQILTEISLGNLDIESVQSLIMDVLYISDESQCESLVQFCFDRTHGNVFFLLSFLSMLKGEELIRYNVGTQSWSWDIDELEQKTAATQNVVDLVMEQMDNTCKASKALLRLAACLGNEFRKETLFLIWTKYMIMDESTFNQTLDELIDCRFLEGMGSSASYRFIHDKVQEAAMALDDSEEKFSSLQYRVGMILSENMEEKQLEEYIFVLANLQSNSTEKSSSIAEINLQAAKKAQTLSAIDSTTKFVSRGIAFLPIGAWQEHPKLSLELHSLGAESEVALGNFDQAEKYCIQVLKQQNVPMADTARIYLVQISIRQGLGEVKEALNLAFDVLNILGCKIPGNRMSTTMTIVRSIWNLRSPPSNDRVAALPLMSDPIKRKIMHVLDMAGLLAHHAGDGQSAMLMRAYQVQWTLKHGVCDQSPSAFAAYAVTCWALGDFPALLKYNEIALTLLDKTPVNFNDPAALLISCNYGLGWVKPIQSIAKKSMEGYKIGMQVGNTMMAMYCVFNYIHCSFVGGGPLKTLEEDCAIYSPQMLGLKRFECNDWLILLWQSAQNLMGLSDNTTVLSGEIIDEVGYREKQSSGSNPVGMILLRYCKVTLCTYFGDYETGAKLSVEKGDEYLTDLPANAIGAFDAFVRGVCLYAMARKSKKSKYKRRANRIRSKLRNWVAKGNPNSAHQSKLLDAEHKALAGYTVSAQKLYHDATVLAARGGFLHDCALANERYAVTLLELNDREAGRDRMERAIRFYATWGAGAKVESLKEAHRELLS